MNWVTKIAKKNGRDYITPEVTEVFKTSVFHSKIRLDVLEVLANQTAYGAGF